MSNDLATIDLQVELSETDIASSDAWSKSHVKRPETRWNFYRLGQIAGIVLVTAASPATAAPDYWFWDRRRRDVSTISLAFDGVIGRPISRTEALQIARQIIENAEQERIQLAEWEAERGIQWDEDK